MPKVKPLDQSESLQAQSPNDSLCSSSNEFISNGAMQCFVKLLLTKGYSISVKGTIVINCTEL